MAKKNFLLGKGERLTEQVRVPSGGGDKVAPYTFSEAKERLQPMIEKVVGDLTSLPTDACPEDYAIVLITLNPEYIAKTYHPSELLRAVGLDTVGSRSRRVLPEKRSKDREPEETVTTELFVCGKRQSFIKWAEEFPKWNEFYPGARQIVEIEEISFPQPATKIKNVNIESSKTVYEVVLHLNEEASEGGYLRVCFG